VGVDIFTEHRQVYRLGGPPQADRGLTPFVGREGELRLLVERLERARAGQGQMVLIVGDPGIGKSRLLQELRRRVTDAATWLEGHAVSFGRTMPFHPLIDLLRRTFRVDEGDPEAAVLGKIEDHILQWGEDLRPVLPFVRALLAVDPGDPGVTSMEPDMRRARIFEATRRLFLRAAEGRLLVIVYEDVHWMDQATEDYLALMADSIATGRSSPLRTCTTHSRHGSSARPRAIRSSSRKSSGRCKRWERCGERMAALSLSGTWTTSLCPTQSRMCSWLA
jgi:predicted ATPase